MSTRNSSILTKKYKLVLSAVHMVYRLVNSTYNVRELSLRLTRLLCQFIHASSASVYLLDEDRKRVAMVASFDHQINIVITKKKELKKIGARELAVVKGASVFEKRVIGVPLVAEQNVGALFIHRKNSEKPFTDFDHELLSVFAEQAVTAMKSLQLYEGQQKTILSSLRLIINLMEKHGLLASVHLPAYSKVIRSLAKKLNMSEEGVECLEYASMLHDAGAINIPYEILSKTSQLTPEEFKIIRNLPAKSVELIKPVDFLKPVLPIILYHREKYDGTGYPSGLKKEQIPLGARIMAVVDAFEAMISHRPYKKVLSIDAALEELQLNSGTQFDPRVIEAFCNLSRQKKFRNYLSLIKR